MSTMRNRYYRTICSLILALSLFLSLNAAAEQQAAAPREIMQAYEDVLFSQRPYLQCDLYDDLTENVSLTGEITDWYGFSFDPPLTFVSFAITDLDLDGNPELLLTLSEDFGYELLRYEGGQVYGFPFFARAMEAVTADGEIHGSSGAENFGWYRVSFSGSEMQTSVVCWMSDEETENPLYLLGDAQCTKDEFSQRNDALWGKETIAFAEYSLENVAAAAAGY